MAEAAGVWKLALPGDEGLPGRGEIPAPMSDRSVDRGVDGIVDDSHRRPVGSLHSRSNVRRIIRAGPKKDKMRITQLVVIGMFLHPDGGKRRFFTSLVIFVASPLILV
jgi:hypothetical protein